MKKLLALLLLLATALSFTACTKKNTEENLLKALGCYAVPGAFVLDQEQIEYTVLDMDGYGRKLVSYTYQNTLSGKKETAYVVCQAHDDDYVYFYEDICYLIGQSTQKKLLALREQNDWNLPIDASKASRRMVQTERSGKTLAPVSELLYNEAYDAIYKALGVKEDDKMAIYFADEDADGRNLYLVSLDPFRPKNTVYYYYVICDSEYNVVHFEIQDVENMANGLAAFKRANGWAYGYESVE